MEARVIGKEKERGKTSASYPAGFDVQPYFLCEKGMEADDWRREMVKGRRPGINSGGKRIHCLHCP